MLNLPYIQAGPTEVLPRSDTPASPPWQNGAGGDPFDQIMRQALSNADSDQKSGSGILSQSNKTTQSLQPDSFNGAKYTAPFPPAETVVASPKTIIAPNQPDNPENSLPLKAFDRTKGNSPDTANKLAQNDPYSKIPAKPASIPTPAGGKGQDGAPTNSKGQNSGKSDASEPATTSAAKVAPPAKVIVQNNLPTGIGNAIYTGACLSPAPTSTNYLSDASSLVATPPTRSHSASGTNAATVSEPSTSRADAATSAILTSPVIEAIQEKMSEVMGIDSSSLAPTAASLDALPPSKGKNMTGSGAGYDPIPAAGSNPASLPVTTLSGASILSGDPFAKTWAKADSTTPQAISSIQQAAGAAGEAATSPNKLVASVANQLIPADGQNASTATNPEAPLVTSTKSQDPSTNPLTSTGPANLSGPASNIGGNAPAISDGTPSALMGALMNNGGKSDNSAGLSGQLLPGGISVVAHAIDLPSGVSQTTVGSAIDVLNSKVSSTPEIWASTHGTQSNSAVDLERTHELVATHAMRLENSGNTSLAVVIKPGGGTQLSLELRQKGNGIEVQASLQQGDYKHLSQNWPELQQRLEQRGIRLAALTDDGSSSFSGGAGGLGSGLFGQSNPQSMEPLVATGLGGTLTTTTTAPSIPVKTAAGWETWA